MKNIFIYFLIVLFAAACGKKGMETDASGTFEAIETIVSAENSGRVLVFKVDEGDKINQGDVCGSIDSVQLELKRKQLYAQIKAVLSRKPQTRLQIAVLQEQLLHAEKEQTRIEQLFKSGAATQKQLDDIKSSVTVLRRQIDAQTSSLSINNTSLDDETGPLMMQIEQINDQIKKCRIINPLSGTVLSKYIQEGEMAFRE